MKKRNKDKFAIEIIGKIKTERNFWIIVAFLSILLNIIQWIC